MYPRPLIFSYSYENNELKEFRRLLAFERMMYELITKEFIRALDM